MPFPVARKKRVAAGTEFCWSQMLAPAAGSGTTVAEQRCGPRSDPRSATKLDRKMVRAMLSMLVPKKNVTSIAPEKNHEKNSLSGAHTTNRITRGQEITSKNFFQTALFFVPSAFCLLESAHSVRETLRASKQGCVTEIVRAHNVFP